MHKRMTAFLTAFLMVLSSVDVSVLAAPAVEDSETATDMGSSVAEAEKPAEGGSDTETGDSSSEMEKPGEDEAGSSAGNGSEGEAGADIGGDSSDGSASGTGTEAGDSVPGTSSPGGEDADSSEGNGSDQEAGTDESGGSDESDSESDTGAGGFDTGDTEDGGLDSSDAGAGGETVSGSDLPGDGTADGETDDVETPDKSLTESFLVDLDSPYYGDYLLAANTAVNGGGESTGTLPDVEEGSGRASREEDVVPAGDGDICGYDESGRGLIDPASFLPEPAVDEGAAYYADIAPGPEAGYEEGDTKSFKLQTGKDTYSQVVCECVAIGTYSTVWIPADDPILLADAGQMKEYMGTLAAEFDEQYPKMTRMFGSKEIADKTYGDGDGRTALLCYDICGDGTGYGAYTAGYFWSADLNAPYSNKTGNNLDCLHIDSWQGMRRNTGSNTLNPTYSKGTMVHELQHMINFSICREKEKEYGAKFNSISTPKYLNEAYSEAAPILCYGLSYDKGRVSHYNSHLQYFANGSISLVQWGSVDTLCSYSMSYLFGQYIRTQYENGDTIYRDSMNGLSPDNNNLLPIIAEKLGVTLEEMLLNFRAALFLKNAEGPYGFKGESWAEDIRSKAAADLSGTEKELQPGTALVVAMEGDYEPSGEGEHIRFAGMNSQMTEESLVEAVQIQGGDSITEKDGTLQLSAAVLPSNVSQSVIFSIPEEADQACASITRRGLLTALDDGTVTVRASSVYRPAVYDEKTVTISGQRQVLLSHREEKFIGGVTVSYEASTNKGGSAWVTYTLDGSDPTQESERMPEEGLTFDRAGVYQLKVLGYSFEEGCADARDEVTVTVEQAEQPEISGEDQETAEEETQEKIIGKRVTLTAQEDALIYYTTDGTVPNVADPDDATAAGAGTKRYTEPFLVDKAGTTVVKAVAVQEGAVGSGVAQQEFYVRYLVSGIALDHTDAELYSNREGAEKTLKLSPVITPGEAADDAALVWSSDDGQIATVDEEGVVTAVSPGKTVISVSADGITASCNITVKAVAEAIAVDDAPPLVIDRDGGTLDISRKIIFLPEGAVEEAVSYQAEPSDRAGDKAGLADISEDGILTAVRDGVVKVTVTARDRDDVKAAVTYVTISGQTSVRLFEAKEDILGGVRITCYPLWPENAEIYYTTDGTEPTVDSLRWQQESMVAAERGLHQFRFLGYDPRGRYTSTKQSLSLYLAQMNAPDIQVEKTEGTARRVTVIAQRGAEIYYTTDGTEPAVENGSVQNGIRYEGPFSADPAAGLSVKAIAVKEGAVTSPVEEYRFDSGIHITGIALDTNSAVLYSSQTAEDRTLLLTPAVTPERASEGLELVWTSDRPDIAKVEPDGSGRGLVTAVAPGEALITVSAGELSAVCIVTVKARRTGQSVQISRTREEALGGVRMTYLVNRPENAVVYYTTDGSMPSEGALVMPEQGIFFGTAGSHMLRIWAHDPSGIYEDTQMAEQVVLGQSEEPVVRMEERDDGRYVMLTAQGNAAIYYTTDGKDPDLSGGVLRHGKKYTGPFLPDGEVSVVKAVAVQEGSVVSQTVVEDVQDRIHVRRITLDRENAELYTDRAAQKSLALAATVLPVSARETVLTWKSDHPEVARVDGEGVVTAVSPGTARITVSADGAVAVCTVTVRSDSGASSGRPVRQGIEIEVDGGLYQYLNRPIETGKSYPYTGAAITPAVVVTNNGEILREGIDYTVKYANHVKVPADNAKDAKRPKITITGKNNMIGKAILYFDISPVDLDDTEGEFIVRVGENSKASPILCYNGSRLVLNRDYKMDCSPNQKWQESGYINFTGIGNYTGTRRFYVFVWEADRMRKFTLKMDKSAKDLSYNGSSQYPAFSVFDRQTGEELEESDYLVVYPKDPAGAGKKKLTVAGKGFYSGCSVTQSYTVKPCQDSSYIRIDGSGVKEEYPFVQSGVTFRDGEIRITYRGRALQEGKDYKIVYSRNKKVGTAKYSITFLGNYKGIRGVEGQTGTFLITAAGLSDLNWQAVALDKVYGKPGIYKTKVYVSVDRVLLKSSDYTVTYELSDGTEMKGSNKLDLDKVGSTVTVCIRGKGNYAGEGEIRTTYEVRPKGQDQIDLSKAKVTVVEDNTGKRLKSVQYDGNVKKPRICIQVKEGRKYRELTQEEYAVLEPYITYVNNVNKGKATVVVNGDGALFTGSRSVTFTIAKRNLTAFF